jgi:hypothetical protein
MIPLKTQIVNIKPREISGSSSANRFGYQQDYALCCLLDLHCRDIDYRMLFDYHDDIAILFPSDDPQKVEFYQVKTDRSKNWTISRLLKRKKSHDSEDVELPSILGKLFVHCLDYPNETSALKFVTNANFSIKLNDGTTATSKTKILLTEIASEEIDIIREKIKKELNEDCFNRSLSITTFEVDSLSLLNHETHALGKLAEFLEKQFDRDDLPVGTLLRTLKDLIAKKQQTEKTSNTFDELCKNKSISSKELKDILNSVIFKKNFEDTWNQIHTTLQAENYTFLEIKIYKDACMEYLLKIIDPINETLQDARNQIRKYLGNKANYKSTIRLTLEKACDDLPEICESITSLYRRTFFEAMVMVHINE